MESDFFDVSIVTPFYKGNCYMEQLLNCITRNAINAPKLKIELLLVNDSPNDEITYAAEWVSGYKVNVLTNIVNLGIQQSRVKGIKAARGKYIIMLDQDDLLCDNAIQSQMDKVGNSDIIVANGLDENPNSRGIIYHSVRHQMLTFNLHYYYSVGNMIVSPGQCLIKKTAIPELWCNYCVKKNGSDDLLLWLILLQENVSWSINSESIYKHIYTGSNVSVDLDKMTDSSMEILNFLKKTNMISDNNLNLSVRRLKMRKVYEGKNILKKIIAFASYPDIALDLMKIKFL